jgi:hypothetical protein
MIEIKELTHADMGRWVVFDDNEGKVQSGRLKSWGIRSIFVVFSCNNAWDHYDSYTSVSCDPSFLTFKEDYYD